MVSVISGKFHYAAVCVKVETRHLSLFTVYSKHGSTSSQTQSLPANFQSKGERRRVSANFLAFNDTRK